jgi:dynein heavy chain
LASAFFRALFLTQQVCGLLPLHTHAGKGTVYDYFVNAKTGKFQPWAEVVQEVQYTGSQAMSSVFVPTAETSSLRFFLDMMVDLHKPIMFVGGA